MAGHVLHAGWGEPWLLRAGCAQIKMQEDNFSNDTKACIFVEIGTLKIHHENKFKIHL